MERLNRGLFITFEGPEGCGKTTQSRLLHDHLRRNYECVYTREPGGTRLGEEIRRILLNSKDIEISDLAELFLFEACRAQIVEEVILPNLEKGKIVICDRFSDATFAYQGYGGKIPLAAIRHLDRIATKSLKPDLTILLDLETLIGLKRAKKKGVDRMEKKNAAYHRRVRMGYLKLAKQEPKRIRVIKVTDTVEKTQNVVRQEVERAVQRYKRPR